MIGAAETWTDTNLSQKAEVRADRATCDGTKEFEALTSNEQPVKASDSVAQNDELKKARVLADRYMTELALKYDVAEAPERAKRIEKAIREALAKDGPQSEGAAEIASTAAESEGKDTFQVTWVQTEYRGADVLFVYRLTRPFTFSTSNSVSLVYEKGSCTIRELRRP